MSSRWTARAAGVAGAALGLALPAVAADNTMGARLFEGVQPLSARIAGQDLALPVTASRCANCHGLGVPGAGVPATAIGPVLSAATLRARQPRRGGPPSAYAEASFCRVLRTGVDAASVIVDRRMPRYAASDADCAVLWTYVTEPR